MSGKSFRFGIDLSAPLPLSEMKAIERGVELRHANPAVFTYPTIAEVVRTYHGLDRSESWWRHQMRGRVPSRARGNSYVSDRAAA